MFCLSCGKRNQDNVVFCVHCGKALPQKSSPIPVVQPIPATNSSPQMDDTPKVRISNDAIRGVITGILIVVLIIVVLLVYYPGVLPWNW